MRLTGGVALVVLATTPAMAIDDEQDVESARATVERWLDVRRTISKEQQEWKVGRAVLTDRADLLRQEVASVRERLAEAQTNVSVADERRAELLEETERLGATMDMLGGTVTSLEARAGDLADRVPEPLRDRVRLLLQRIPKDPQETELTIAERFVNLAGLLNEIDKFHSQVNATSQVLSLAQDERAEVTAFYLGIAIGYYVNPDAGMAGIGSGARDGWEWMPLDDTAARIAAAVAILEGQPAAFVQLPVRID